MRSYFFLISCLLAVCLWMPSVQAADKDLGRTMRQVQAIDTVTLQSEGVRIVLWGIKPAPASAVPFQLNALQLLDREIGSEPVNCKILSGFPPEITARCISYNNADLGLELLHHGYAVVDRRQAAGSSFAADYRAAEETARRQEKGVWRLAAANERDSAVLPWVQAYMPLLVPAALVGGPLAAVLLALFVMYAWMRKISSVQREELGRFQRKENALLFRERQVLVATLEGELMENRSKIEAYLSVYRDMLKGLHDEQKMPKYQHAGDVVQKNPFLNKTVFRANVPKLSLLDVKLAGQVSKLYAAMPEGQDYIKLEPSLPLAEALQAVEAVIAAAEALLPAVDQVLLALRFAAGKQNSENRKQNSESKDQDSGLRLQS